MRLFFPNNKKQNFNYVSLLSYLHKLCYYIRFVLGIKYWLKANVFINQTGYRKVKLHLAGYRKLPLYTGSSKNLRGSNLSYPSTLSKFSPLRPLTCMLHLSMLKYERKKIKFVVLHSNHAFIIYIYLLRHHDPAMAAEIWPNTSY